MNQSPKLQLVVCVWVCVCVFIFTFIIFVGGLLVLYDGTERESKKDFSTVFSHLSRLSS